MRKMLGLAAAVATAIPAMTFAALPTAASAQVSSYLNNPCGPQQRNARLGGAALGGLAGAAVGSQVAAKNARKEGAILGGLVGAAAGQEIARRRSCSTGGYAYAPQGYAQGYGQQAYAPAACKAVQGGRYVCLQPDGRWR
jgi:hypothetical protein